MPRRKRSIYVNSLPEIRLTTYFLLLYPILTLLCAALTYSTATHIFGVLGSH